MSAGNNIDGLFKSKLAGREVAYSASAWAGANQMLNQHYKWLFLRKLLWILIPVAVFSGIGVGYFSDKTSAENISNSHSQHTENLSAINELECMDEASLFNQASDEPSSYTNLNRAETDQRPEEVRQTIVASSNVNQPESKSIAAVSLQKPKSKTALGLDKNQNSAVRKQEVKKKLSTSHRRNLLKDLNIEGRKMISNDLAKIILNKNLEFMPISALPFNGIQDSSDMFDRDFSEPIMEELRKIQLFVEGGILVAQGQHDLNVNRKAPGIGLHTSLLAKYNLGESVFLDLRIGLYNRSSLTPTLGFAGSQMNSFIEIKPLLINYGSIYIGTGYQIGARHSIGGGLEFNPMLSVLARKDKTIIGESKSESSYLRDNTGFNGLDAAAIINYRLSISEKLDATAEMHFGLFDATDNAVFNTGDVNDHNTLIKLGLSYRITNR